MDVLLAEKIVGDLKKFSNKKYAVLNDCGEVLANSKKFSIEHNVLDVDGKKSFPVHLDTKKIGYIYIDEHQDVVSRIGPIAKSMAELIAQQVRYTEILTSDEKRIDQLAYDFFQGEEKDQAEIVRVLRSFGLRIEKNRVAIFLEISDSDYLLLDSEGIREGEKEARVVRAKRSIEDLLKSFYASHPDNLVFYFGRNNFLILKDMGNEPKEYQKEFVEILEALHFNLKNELMVNVTIGVGNFKPGIKGIKESFKEAKTALKLGKQMWGEEKTYHFDNFGVVAPLFSGSSSENITFSKKVIKSLEDHPELYETLKEYLDNDLSLSKTAKKLKIHRNTLVYRIEKIGEITGLDPKVFEDAFQLQMSIMLARYND